MVFRDSIVSHAMFTSIFCGAIPVSAGIDSEMPCLELKVGVWNIPIFLPTLRPIGSNTSSKNMKDKLWQTQAQIMKQIILADSMID